MKRILQLFLLSAVIGTVAFGGAGCTKKAKLARAYARADKYFAAGDYDKADVEYINVLRQDRFASRAYAQLGIMSLEDGRIARAAAALLRAVKMDSNNVDLHVKLGTVFLAAGDLRDSRIEALYVLDHRPDDPDAPLLLADSAVTLNDYEVTRQRLQKLNVPAAKHAPIDVALGGLYFKEHEFKRAQDALERARGEDPKFGPLYMFLGSMYQLQNDPKRAEEAFKMASDSAPIRSPRRLKYVQYKIETGDMEAGKRLLREMVEKAPDYLPATIVLAQIAVKEKKIDEANALLEKVLARDPDNFDALDFSGLLAMNQGNIARGVAQFEKLVRVFGKSSAKANYDLALAYDAANDSTKAIESLNRALTINSNYFDAEVALAQVKIGKGDLNSAIVTLKHVTQVQPRVEQPHMLLAEAYHLQGDLEKADGIYKMLENADPTNSKVPALRGIILLQANRRDEARKEFERSLQITPGYLNPVEQLVNMDIAEGQFARAEARAQNLAKLDTNAPEPSLMAANIKMAQNQNQEAATILQNAITAHPEYKSAWLLLANLYISTGQIPKSVETARALLAKHPEDPAGLMVLATGLEAQKDIPGAEAAYEKVLKVSPKNSVALNNLAYLYAEHGETDKALDLARRAKELMPYDPATADTLGWVLYHKGDYVQAAVILQDSATKAPGVPDIVYHLGMTRYMMGEESTARTVLQKALEFKQAYPGKENAALSLSILAIDPKSATPDARALLEKRVAEQPGDPIAQSRLAMIYKRDGAIDKAIPAYEATIKANPKNVRALVDLAEIYSARPDQKDKAFSVAKSAYKLAPDDPDVTRVLGPLAFRAGDYKWSLGLLQDTIKARPSDPELLFDLAQSSYSMGQVADAYSYARQATQIAGFTRTAEAKRFLEMVPLADNPAQAEAAAPQVDQALKADPEYVPALMAAGVIAERKGASSAAKASFEKVLAHYPDFVPVKRHLAILYGQTTGGDDKHFLEVAFKAYEAYPGDADVIESVGLINYRLGDYSKAARYLKESDGRKPGDAQLQFYLGMSQYHLKQKADSKKTLSKALDLKLPDPQAAEARKALAELK